jgi:hypothetical protein
MKFLIDNNISYRIAEALTALDFEGDTVIALRKEFRQDVPDTEWLESLGKQAGVLITADRRILTRPLEITVIKHAKITSFFLGPFFPKARFWEQAVWLIKRWPDFKNAARIMEQGTCLWVPQRGTMRPISP